MRCGNYGPIPNKGRDRWHPQIPLRVDHLNERGRLGMSKPSFAAVSLVAVVSWPGAASAQATVGTLTGVITDSAGSAVAGAFVQMRNAERRLNFMVITREQGKYSID